MVPGLLLLAACLNLDLPDVPTTPPKPELVVDAPKPGDTISLSAEVVASAASVNGVSTVSVLCGPDGGARTIYTWTAPPYAALVSFGLCQDVTVPNPGDGGPFLPIAVIALTDAGAVQEVAFDVIFNTAGPALTVQYAPTAQPKSPFSVTVTSSVPLRSIPTVALDLNPADSVTAVASLPNTYLATFNSTPGLGTDALNAPPYTPGVPVPIEILTDTDRTVRLTVTGTAANGNTTSLDLSVDLSRVVWDRYIPGQPATSSPTTWAAEPVAFDGGLVLPLATSAPSDATSNWLPGRLDFFDGTFFGLDTKLLPGGLDGGFLARGLNAQGATLFARGFGQPDTLLLVPPPPQTSPLPTTTQPGTVPPPLTKVDDKLCLQDSVTACSTGTTEGLTCFDPDLVKVTVTSGIVSTGPPTAGVVAAGGGRYLSPNVAVCGSSWNLVDLAAGTVSFGPLQDPNLDAGSCAIAGIVKLIAVGDGTFVVQLVSNCFAANATPPVFSIVRVGANSQVLGAYTAPFGTPSIVQREVVGALVDGRVVTLRNAPPYTVFELWKLNQATPDVMSPIAGLFQSADAVLGSVLAQSSFAAEDGSFAVLLSGDTSFGAAVAAFGPNLQPRYLYLYPRLADATSMRQVSASNVGDVYLVDNENNRAVSLRVVPPPPPAIPDAGPPVTDQGIYITQGGNSVLVFPLGATGNTPPLRTISGAQTGLSLPLGIARDSAGNLYVANREGSTVTVYPPLASGNVAPIRTLTATGMGSPEGLAMGVGGDLYVSTCPDCGSSAGGLVGVFHFPAQAIVSDYSLNGGSSTDIREPGSIALGDVVGQGQVLYVGNAGGYDVATFAYGAQGNTEPINTFNPIDGDANIQSMAYSGGTLFLGIPGVGVGLFPADSTEVPDPSSALLPPGFVYPGGVFVDDTVTPPVVYLVDATGNAVYVMQTAGTLPNLTIQSVTTISGPATGLSEPLEVYVVK
jgi:hypothetical protein